jgi:hypothetical protein
MIGSTEISLIIADLLIEMANNRVPADELFIRYKNVVDNSNVGTDYIHFGSSKLIKHLKAVYRELKARYSQDQIMELYINVFSKVDTLIDHVNASFYPKYFIALDFLGNTQGNVSEKIQRLEDCLKDNDSIGNPVYEVEYYSILLSILLLEEPSQIDKIEAISTKLKSAIAEKNKLPIELLML